MPGLASLEVSTWVAAVYSLVLLAVAYGIDAMARKASHALEARQNPGFTYHAETDAWLCPEDEWLWPKSFDPDERITRYQAPAHVCQSCLKVSTCTEGGGGREITRKVDPWPASEAARFHRGIACTITVLAIVWPIAWLLSFPPPLDAVVLSLVLALVIGGSLPLWMFLRRSPIDPTGVLQRDSDANVLERQQQAFAYTVRTSTYWSEKRIAAERLAEEGRKLREQREATRKTDAVLAAERVKDDRRLARLQARLQGRRQDRRATTDTGCATDVVGHTTATGAAGATGTTGAAAAGPARAAGPRLSRKERRAAERQAQLDQIGSFT